MKPLFTGALLLLLAAGCSVGERIPSSGADVLDKMSYIVAPHPDDEMQAWSLIENTPDAYKVFVILTNGEQTAYCASPGYDEGTGEASPLPWPAGKWTSSCESARQNSFFDFIAEMARSDDGLPSSFIFEGVKGPFDSLGYMTCRHDDDGCVSDRTAKVWVSEIAAVVWFNLGDGDLTDEEVEWAVKTVRDNRSALGINSSLQNGSLIGASYWNGSSAGCFMYTHEDHLAVYEALWDTDFDMGYQAAASCQTGPGVARLAQVSEAHFDDAFEASGTTRVGSHVVNYGWLSDEGAGYWPGDYSGQGELFHREQAFRVRFSSS